MTREEIIKGLGEISVCQIWEDEVIDEAIKTLEQEPCDDTISREAVINALGEWIVSGEYQYTNATDYLVKRVKALPGVPPVTPAEKTGNWIACSDRLPEAGEYVGDVAKYYLAQNEYGDMLVARYTHSGYWEQIYQLKPIDNEIVAWCELPEPYKASPTGEESTCDDCKTPCVMYEKGMRGCISQTRAEKEYKTKVITRGNCMLCGKELTEGLFFCKGCGDKANSGK